MNRLTRRGRRVGVVIASMAMLATTAGVTGVAAAGPVPKGSDGVTWNVWDAGDGTYVVTKQSSWKGDSTPDYTCTKTSADYCDGSTDFSRTGPGYPWTVAV